MLHVWKDLKECVKYSAANSTVRVRDQDAPTDYTPDDQDETCLDTDDDPPSWQPVGPSRPRPLGRNKAKRAKAADPHQIHMLEAIDEYNDRSRVAEEMRHDRERARQEREVARNMAWEAREKAKEARERAREAREQVKLERAIEWEEGQIMDKDLTNMNDMQREYWGSKQAEIIARRRARATSSSAGYYPDMTDLNQSYPGYPPNN